MNQRGFTLIEIMVVIAIIGILSVVVLAALNLARSRGDDAAVKKALVGTRSQAELFFGENGNRYVVTPGTATDLCSPLADGSATGGVKGIYSQFEDAADAAGLSTADIQTSRTVAGASGKATCHACPAGIVSGVCGGLNSNAWAAEVPLKTGGFWCVDSSGFSAYNANTALASGDARCL